jgi:hypothetical protein
MKKIFTLLAITIFLSCSTEKETCKCTGKYLTNDGGQFFVPNQPIDCDTKQPTKLAQSGFFVGCVD